MNTPTAGFQGKVRSKSTLVGMIFAGVGALFFLVGCYLIYDASIFLKTALPAEGTVLSVERKVSRDSDGKSSVTYQPTFAFADKVGQQHQATTSQSSSSYNFARGEQVAILYDPDDPLDVRVDGVFSIWFLPLMFAGMGLVFVVVGAFVLAKRSRRAKVWETAPEAERISVVRRQ